MASSFIDQVPAIVQLSQKLKPKTVLDIGKGFGKFGFLLQEYIGIINTMKVNPDKSLREQSSIKIDTVEVDADLMLPHLSQLYNTIYFGDILKLYKNLPFYELVLMIDIIEHINKEEALLLLKHLVQQGTKIIIATPIHFFEQHLYASKFENHISHWTKNDFKNIGFLHVQYFNAGAIYLLSKEKLDIRGFGNSWIKKLRRIARAIKNEV